MRAIHVSVRIAWELRLLKFFIMMMMMIIIIIIMRIIIINIILSPKLRSSTVKCVGKSESEFVLVVGIHFVSP